jgi:hypothetical protein
MNSKENILDIEKEIQSILSLHYSREERKWKSDNEEEIKTLQLQLRNLKHKKWDLEERAYLEDVNPDPRLVVMLKPVINRRGLKSTDEFYFEQKGLGYQPKHVATFWSCPGCLLDTTKGFEGDLGNYNRQIEWCPKFLQLLRDKTPDEYAAIIRKANPEVPICYAGLMHSEMQQLDNEVRFVRQCDNCGWTTIESHKVAEEFDNSNYTVGLDNKGKEDATVVTCNCKDCGERIFEEFADKCSTVNENGERELTPEYDQKLSDHYKEKHPNED